MFITREDRAQLPNSMIYEDHFDFKADMSWTFMSQVTRAVKADKNALGETLSGNNKQWRFFPAQV